MQWEWLIMIPNELLAWNGNEYQSSRGKNKSLKAATFISLLSSIVTLKWNSLRYIGSKIHKSTCTSKCNFSTFQLIKIKLSRLQGFIHLHNAFSFFNCLFHYFKVPLAIDFCVTHSIFFFSADIHIFSLQSI